MADPIQVAIHGSAGRMGQRLIDLGPSLGFEITGTIDQGDDLASGLTGAQVVIDFSVAAAADPLLEACQQRALPLVIGTTGHDPEQLTKITATAQDLPIVKAGNYSLGVTLLTALSRIAARALPESYQPEVTEVHHRQKRDAPSGTALQLAQAVRAARGWSEDTESFGRHGLVDANRPDREVGIHAIRGGQVVGDHTVNFFGEEERIELTHRAADRAAFARGAFQAARWLVETSPAPGLYDMEDVLGLKALGEA